MSKINMSRLEKFKNLLVTDIGSTTTKALLIGNQNGTLSFVGSIEVPTTVEKPEEDVKIGIRKAVKLLEEQTGTLLTDSSGNLNVPYLTTSSAGGGLQMLVFGLTSVETGRVAEMTAYGAGGVVLRTMTIDDEMPKVEKMRLMRDLHPDLILMAGGTDQGAIAGVVHLAEILTLANPQPKFRQNLKIPLVFCGNVDARNFVTNVLEDTFDVHIVENIRPSTTEFNLEPAKEKVHQLFMDNVMERAPGYSELRNMVAADIIPTPAGVENILRLYGNTLKENVVMMDMGGATTDIFSNIIGNYHRTVSANIGMSYSISNILSQTGIANIMKHLPASFKETEVRDYVANKTLYPVYVPESPEEILVEQAFAIEGASIAWKQHLYTNFRTVRLGFLDRLKKSGICKFEQQFFMHTEKPFCLSDIGVIVGAGGVISHTDRNAAMRIMTEAFRPHGITKLIVDRNFRSAHLGVLATISPEAALDLFLRECVEEIGWVVAPVGKIKLGKNVLRVKNLRNGDSRELAGGEFLFLESGGDIELIPEEGIALGRNGGKKKLVTELPVLVDCRGRENSFIESALSHSGIPEFTSEMTQFYSGITPQPGKVITGEYEIEYKLPYEGSIFISVGDSVESGDIIGENRFAPPRIYILDLNRTPGYDRHLTVQEVLDGLLVGVGDIISTGQPIYKITRHGIAGFNYRYSSPVRGRIIKIEKTGLIILREVQDYDGEPHEVDIAGPLGIKPRHIRGHLKYRVDSFVGADFTLAHDIRKGIFIKSPTSGILKKVDTRKGTVTIQYDIKPIPLKAYIKGTISRISENYAVLIKGIGTTIQGKIGFGDKTYGRICVCNKADIEKMLEKSILVSKAPINQDFLRRAVQIGVSGIIAPSIPNADWVQFYGEELGVALTGDENIPFTLILTEGFGNFPMNESFWKLLETSNGKIASLSGRTQIRAGVTRPYVIIT